MMGLKVILIIATQFPVHIVNRKLVIYIDIGLTFVGQ